MTADLEFHDALTRAAAAQGYGSEDAAKCVRGALNYVGTKPLALASLSELMLNDRRQALRSERRALRAELERAVGLPPVWAFLARWAASKLISWALNWIINRWTANPMGLTRIAEGR